MSSSPSYLYQQVALALFEIHTSERAAFRAHLKLVAEALRSIERVDCGHCAPGAESEAIRACLNNAAVVSVSIREAKQALADLADELNRCALSLSRRGQLE